MACCNVLFGSVNEWPAHVATDKSIRDPLSASHLTSARSAAFWISSKKTLAAALSPKSLPGTLPYQNFEINLSAVPKINQS